MHDLGQVKHKIQLEQLQSPSRKIATEQQQDLNMRKSQNHLDAREDQYYLGAEISKDTVLNLQNLFSIALHRKRASHKSHHANWCAYDSVYRSFVS